jgi:NAD-dependent dihydropyrimidine dehydrogenase PreA subunit/flavodoxin
MIFYFSGTGNSEWAARRLAEGLGEKLMFIPDALGSDMTYELKDGEPLGFVFPCYGWGVPTFIEKFIRQCRISNVSYLYYVCTCGDDTGHTDRVFRSAIATHGWNCSLCYDIKMPEAYISLPGFNVDPKEKEQNKLEEAEKLMEEIISSVSNRKQGSHLLPGALAWAKTRIVRPVFNGLLMSPSPFKYTDRCTGCGKCERTCPMHNISLDKDRKPQWKKNCTGCLRCYHTCPSNAIQYGIFTKGKGQYLHPDRKKK